MDRTVSQTARILGSDVSEVKKWAWLFKDYLGTSANPAKGRVRTFADADVLALIYVATHWVDEPDLEAIRMGLNVENHHEDGYREILYRHTPLLQEPPDGLDETWRHGVFLNGGSVNEFLELARNYKQTAEAVLESALKSGEPRDWGYPVMFAYRHTLELYLKVIGEIEEETHSLKNCVRLVESVMAGKSARRSGNGSWSSTASTRLARPFGMATMRRGRSATRSSGWISYSSDTL